MSQFPEDEFDRLGRERRATGVAGAHRKRPNSKPWWIALVAILIIAPLAGWGIVQAMGSRGTGAEPAPTASSSVPAEDNSPAPAAPEDSAEAPAPEATSEAPETPSPTPSPTPEAPTVDKGLTVLVLNATGRTGYAAETQSQLKADGWGNTAIGTYQYARPAASQIFYDSEEHQAAAQALGQKLGISDLILNADATGDYPIVVVLAQ